jgi:hypothetical protein
MSWINIADNLLCLYSARVTKQEDMYTVEVPKQEVQRGSVQTGETYRVALVSATIDKLPSETNTQGEETTERNSQPSSRDA